MPYIDKFGRPRIDELIDQVVAETPGELNYAITRLIIGYIEDKKDTNDNTSYQHINDVVGALEGAKLEFYRRFVSKYEDRKTIENGDVY